MDFGDPKVQHMTLRNVACNADTGGGGNKTIMFDKKNPSIEDYTHCKTQLKTLNMCEWAIIDGEPIDENFMINFKKDNHIAGASIVFVDRGAEGSAKLVEEFTLDKKTNLWTCVWSKPKRITFPQKVEIILKYKDHAHVPKLYEAIKFETKLTDPEHPPSGCCAIQ